MPLHQFVAVKDDRERSVVQKFYLHIRTEPACLHVGYAFTLPALLNEVISLLKETSISGYIGLMDLTKGGDIIRSNTYEAFLPLIAVAIIYLALVMLLSFLAGKLERRLRNNER